MAKTTTDRGAKPAIRPNRWTPPKAPPRARQRHSDEPVDMSVVELPGRGAEDVVMDADGRVLGGLEDGRIVRLTPHTGAIETLATTGGRPLGLELHPDGWLIVCDSFRGLLRVDLDTGSVRTLLADNGGRPMVFCSNAVVGRDGSIYFSESSTHVHVSHYTAEALEHSRTGRVSRLRPDGSVDVLADDLRFANGLVLAEDDSWIAVAETTGYAIAKLWLSGAKAGTREPIVANMPGLPDNMSRGSDGLIWVALETPRNPLLDFLLPRAPVLRRIAWALPDPLRPKETHTVWVQAYTDDGRLVHDLQTEHDRFFLATGLVERDGDLWVGSLQADTLARIRIAQSQG
jgi:sugar lactone lactonase YvrE